MLAVMRDPHVALDTRVKMAFRALHRLHRRLRAGESPSLVGDQSLPIENLSTNARRVSMAGSVSEAAGIKSEKPSTGARASGALADVLIPEREGARVSNIKLDQPCAAVFPGQVPRPVPLPFLLAAVR